MPKLHWKAALHLHYCMSVIVRNVSITIYVGINGLVVFNSMMMSTFQNVHVMVIPLPVNSSYTELTTNGMYIYMLLQIEQIN